MRLSSACSSRWGKQPLGAACQQPAEPDSLHSHKCVLAREATQHNVPVSTAIHPCTFQYSELVAEKNASLESLVRATAAAATEAGKLVR